MRPLNLTGKEKRVVINRRPSDELLGFLRQLARNLRVHLVETDLKHGRLRRPKLDEGGLPGSHLYHGAAQGPVEQIYS